MSSLDDRQTHYFRINTIADVATTRRKGLLFALDLGCSNPDATKIAVVISELGRNICNYAGKGTITLMANETSRGRYIKIIANDKGPGISNLDLVLAGGYTTSKGMGLGVSGSKKLMDEFTVQTEIGYGTTITALKWLK